MKPRTLLFACLALAALHAGAAQLMSAPITAATPQDSAGLIARLNALDARPGLSADYSFRISSQHPGVVGQKITRAQHTYKGLRVFGSESVVVTNSAGDILSVSAADRRPGRSRKPPRPAASPRPRRRPRPCRPTSRPA